MAIIKLQTGKFTTALIGGTIFVFISLYLLIFHNFIEFPVFFLLLFGAVCSFYGVHYLVNRNRHSIIIDKKGIIIFNDGHYTHFSAEKISWIHSYGSQEKPRVEITFLDGEIIHLFIPSYCKPETFIKNCKDAGLPCA